MSDALIVAVLILIFHLRVLVSWWLIKWFFTTKTPSHQETLWKGYTILLHPLGCDGAAIYI